MAKKDPSTAFDGDHGIESGFVYILDREPLSADARIVDQNIDRTGLFRRVRDGSLERRHVGYVRRHCQCFAVDHTRRLVRRILEAIHDNCRPARCQHDGMMPPHAATCACNQRDPAVH